MKLSRLKISILALMLFCLPFSDLEASVSGNSGSGQPAGITAVSDTSDAPATAADSVPLKAARRQFMEPGADDFFLHGDLPQGMFKGLFSMLDIVELGFTALFIVLMLSPILLVLLLIYLLVRRSRQKAQPSQCGAGAPREGKPMARRTRRNLCVRWLAAAAGLGLAGFLLSSGLFLGTAIVAAFAGAGEGIILYIDKKDKDYTE